MAVLAEALQEQLLQQLLLLRHGKEDARVRGQLLAQVLHAVRELVDGLDALGEEDGACGQGCQMAKFDPFLSLDCATVEGVGAQSKERKGPNFAT